MPSETLETAPTVEPVTVDELMRHCRITIQDDDQDQYLSDLITAARRYCEKNTNRAFISQTWELRLDDWPSDDIIRPPRPPLQSVETFAYTDAAGDAQTLTENTDFVVDIYSTPGRVMLAYNKSWPDVYDQPNAITVTYEAGYGDTADDVPAELRQAILFLAAHWFEVREPVSMGAQPSRVPLTVDALLDEYRIVHYCNQMNA